MVPNQKGSKFVLKRHFDELESKIEAFADSFQSVLRCLTSLKCDALGNDRGPRPADRGVVTAPLLSSLSSKELLPSLPSNVQLNGGPPSPTASRWSTAGADTPSIASDNQIPTDVDDGEFPDALVACWRNTPESCRSIPIQKLSASVLWNTSIGSSKADTGTDLMKLHDRWDSLYLANETKILMAEQADYARLGETRRQSTHHLARNILRMKVSSCIGENVPIHPYSAGRIVWEVIGLCLVAFDLFYLPLRLAWDIHIGVGTSLLLVNIPYWTADIALTFNTGYMDKSGMVILSRTQVALNYCNNWLVFDVIVILIDYLILIFESTRWTSIVRTARVFRLLRLVRGLRLLKMRQLSHKFEDIFSTHGRHASVHVLAIIKTLLFIFSLAHILACLWFAVGKDGESHGKPSWLDELRRQEPNAGILDEYVQSLTWVLGYITANAVEGSISPQRASERVFMLTVLLTSVLVIGGVIGRITETLVAIEKMTLEYTQAKRVLQRFFQENEAPISLRLRAVQFVLYRLKQKNATYLDSSIQELLSPSLFSELLVSQRLRHVCIYPLYHHIQEHHEHAMVLLCSTFDARVFGEREHVFVYATSADTFVITRQGKFIHTVGVDYPSELGKVSRSGLFSQADYADQSRDQSRAFTTEATWFAEYSLFAKGMYQGSLIAQTLADAFTISGAQFADAVIASPSCILLICKYAKIYLRLINASESFAQDEDHNSEQKSSQSVKILREVQQSKHLYTRAALSVMQGASPRELESRWDFLGRVYDREISIDDTKSYLDWLFPEFDSQTAFIVAQPTNTCLTPDQWAELQEVYKWVAIDKDRFRAILVFLAIYGLGKIEAIVKSYPVHLCDPESVLSQLIERKPHFVPSTQGMPHDMKTFIYDILGFHAVFNVGQLVQGENTPSQVAALKAHLQTTGDQSLFKCYLLSVFGIMCSPGATSFDGSRCMDSFLGTHILLVFRCFNQLAHEQPQRLFWSLIKKRANLLGLPVATIEDYVLARLSCLTRTTPEDCPLLVIAWQSLHRFEREQLVSHFVADGIVEHAVMFVFLPDFLSKATTNAHVGLRRALSILVELLDVLYTTGYIQVKDAGTTFVSLQNLAKFVLEVRNARTIDVLAGHVTFVEHGKVLLATVSTTLYQKLKQSLWREEKDLFTQNKDIAYSLKRLERQASEHEQALSRMQSSLGRGALLQNGYACESLLKANTSSALGSHEDQDDVILELQI